MVSKQMVDAIVDLFVALNENDIGTYDDIFNAAQIRPPVYDRLARIWAEAMSRAREILLDVHNIVLENVPRVGYRVSDPESRIRISQDIMKRSRKVLEKGEKITIQTDPSRLTRIGRAERRKFIKAYGRALKAFDKAL